MPDDLAGAIRGARTADPRWTQAFLARKACVSRDTIRRAEKGGENLEWDTLRRIVAVLDEKTGGEILASARLQTTATAESSDTESGTDQGSSEVDGESDMKEALKNPQVRRLVDNFVTLSSRERSDILATVLDRASAHERRRWRAPAKKVRG